jgi:hypothetical protein
MQYDNADDLESRYNKLNSCYFENFFAVKAILGNSILKQLPAR